MVPYAFSKLAIALISPLGTALALLGAGSLLHLTARRRRASRAGMILIVSGVAWLWLWSMPVASDWLVQRAESEFPPLAAEALPEAEAIVVIGGALFPPSPGMPYPDMGAAADRAWHAARLFHAGKAPLVVASGGGDPEVTPVSEAEALRGLLVDLGVPHSALLLETRSRNTRENAEFTAALLKQREVRRILLVTSALHMRRAVAEFHRTGLQVIPAATDHAQAKVGGMQRWVPETGALDASARTLKEMVGKWVQAR